MSDEEVVREAWRRWNAGDRSLDPTLFHQDIEVHSALTGTVWVGENGVEAWAAEIDDQFERWEVRIDELAVVEGRVAAAGHISARGRGSGLGLDQPASWLIDLREGRIVRIRNLIGHDAAHAAIAAGSSQP